MLRNWRGKEEAVSRGDRELVARKEGGSPEECGTLAAKKGKYCKEKVINSMKTCELAKMRTQS